MKRIVKFTVVFVVAAALAAAIVFFDFSANEMRFVTVSSEEELVNALIDQFDTGYESVIVRTKGFRITQEKIASYISSEIANDPEDLCIMPASYTAGIFDIINLWQFRLYFGDTRNMSKNSVSVSEQDAAENGGGDAVQENRWITYTEEEVLEAQLRVSAELDRVCGEIAAKAGDDDRQLHREIFNYLCENVEYDYELSDVIVRGDLTDPLRKNRGAYGALIERKTVCSGYAAAYKAICDRLKLDCLIAESEDHAWNLIRIGGQVYCVDATSGDQGTWIADQFFMADPAKYETEYGYGISENCYIPERFRV